MHREHLLSIGFSKPGLFIRWMLKNLVIKWNVKCDYILWIKNPTIMCFDDYRTEAIPNSPLATTPEQIFATTVFALIRNNQTIQLEVQIFQSYTWARGFAIDFRDCALNRFGNCRCSKPTLIPRFRNDLNGIKDTKFCAWNTATDFLICEMSNTGDSCYIHWAEGDMPSNVEPLLTNSAGNIDEISNKLPWEY